MHNRSKKTEDAQSTSANSENNAEQQRESLAPVDSRDAHYAVPEGLKRRIFAGSPKRDEDYLN